MGRSQALGCRPSRALESTGLTVSSGSEQESSRVGSPHQRSNSHTELIIRIAWGDRNGLKCDFRPSCIFKTKGPLAVSPVHTPASFLATHCLSFTPVPCSQTPLSSLASYPPSTPDCFLKRIPQILLSVTENHCAFSRPYSQIHSLRPSLHVQLPSRCSDEHTSSDPVPARGSRGLPG